MNRSQHCYEPNHQYPRPFATYPPGNKSARHRQVRGTSQLNQYGGVHHGAKHTKKVCSV